jgi:hypothetical protein
MFIIKPAPGWDRSPIPLPPTVDTRLMPLQAQPQPTYECYPQQHHDVKSNCNYFSCKVCDRGAMSQERIYRMSLPVVVIGFILLVPSVLAMMFLTIGFLASLGATASVASTSSQTASLTTRKQVIDNLRYAAVPSSIINAVISGDDATVDADMR